MAAVLIAGGQHSLLECLVVAQLMGYFADLPNVLTAAEATDGSGSPDCVSYTSIAMALEEYLANLGFAPTSSEIFGDTPPLAALHARVFVKSSLKKTGSSKRFYANSLPSIDIMEPGDSDGADDEDEEVAFKKCLSEQLAGRDTPIGLP